MVAIHILTFKEVTTARHSRAIEVAAVEAPNMAPLLKKIYQAFHHSLCHRQFPSHLLMFSRVAHHLDQRCRGHPHLHALGPLEDF